MRKHTRSGRNRTRIVVEHESSGDSGGSIALGLALGAAIIGLSYFIVHPGQLLALIWKLAALVLH